VPLLLILDFSPLQCLANIFFLVHEAITFEGRELLVAFEGLGVIKSSAGTPALVLEMVLETVSLVPGCQAASLVNWLAQILANSLKSSATCPLACRHEECPHHHSASPDH